MTDEYVPSDAVGRAAWLVAKQSESFSEAVRLANARAFSPEMVKAITRVSDFSKVVWPLQADLAKTFEPLQSALAALATQNLGNVEAVNKSFAHAATVVAGPATRGFQWPITSAVSQFAEAVNRSQVQVIAALFENSDAKKAMERVSAVLAAQLKPSLDALAAIQVVTTQRSAVWDQIADLLEDDEVELTERASAAMNVVVESVAKPDWSAKTRLAVQALVLVIVWGYILGHSWGHDDSIVSELRRILDDFQFDAGGGTLAVGSAAVSGKVYDAMTNHPE